MSKALYEILEHTADLRILVRARDLKGLFQNTALALFDIIAEKKHGVAGKQEKITLRLNAGNQEELLVAWLNTLLSLSNTQKRIFIDFRIDSINENSLAATVTGEPIHSYAINREVKAATYHQLAIERDAEGWKTEVIFDV